jgi:sugar phosphate isomerase/epimerase
VGALRAAAFLVGVLLAAGCGGEPRLSQEVARPLAHWADEVAAALELGDACGARRVATALRRGAIAAINDGDVPEDDQEELLGAVNELVEGISCTPPAADDDAAADARELAERLRERSG